MESTRCCIPGCENRTPPDLAADAVYGLCSAHRELVSGNSRALLRSAARRLVRLERSWGDPKVFHAIASRGRHLAFCALLRAAHEHVERAWQRVRIEAAGARGDFHPSPEIAPDHHPGRGQEGMAASLAAVSGGSEGASG